MDADQVLETELNFYLVNLPNKLMDNWIARVAFRQQAVYELLSLYIFYTMWSPTIRESSTMDPLEKHMHGLVC